MVTAELLGADVPLLLPRYGFPKTGRTEPVPGLYENFFAHRFTAHELLIMHRAEGLDRPEWYQLRPAETPRPRDAYHAMLLTSGPAPYMRSPNRTAKHLPFWYRLMSGTRWSYVVWGKPPFRDKPGIVYDVNRTARTNRGRGVIYTQYPVYNDQGRLVEYVAEYRKIEFQVRDRDPSRPDQLLVGTNRHRESLPPGGDPYHELTFFPNYGDDEHWQQLILAARNGFVRHCQRDIDDETETWRVWFLDQMRKADAARRDHTIRTTWGGPGWLAALDAVEEAHQLEPVLWQYAPLFPEVGPDAGVALTADQLEEPDRFDTTMLISPRYSGTTGGEEQRLLAAYYKVRPHRRALLEGWMENFRNLRSNILNYTGD